MPRIVGITNIKFSHDTSKKGKNAWQVLCHAQTYKFVKTQRDKDPHSFDPEPSKKVKENIIAAFHQKALNAKKVRKKG